MRWRWGCAMKKKYFLFALFVPINSYAFNGIDIPSYKPFTPDAVVRVDGSEVLFDGLIEKGSAKRLIKSLQTKKIKIVSINSMGGDVESAINIAKEILEKKLDVKVRDVCASACANYIFPSGNRKLLGGRSLLLFHGSVNSPVEYIKISGDISIENFMNLPSIKKLKKEEVSFYKRINVKENFPYCPQQQPNYEEKYPEKWFSYTPENIKAFGVKNIFISGGSKKWVLYLEKRNVVFSPQCL